MTSALIYHLAGWLVAAAAALVLLWALCLDRNRKKRRCPKCWYDMSGTPGLRCPECGREVRRERSLHRARRRWKWTPVSLILCVAGYLVWCQPRYEARGWVGLVPSTCLACMAPTTDFVAAAPSGLRTTTTVTPTRGEQLTFEFWTRLDEGKLARWQSEIFLNRYMRAHKIDIHAIAKVPPRWPLGRPIPVRVKPATVAELEVLVGQTRASGPTFAPWRSTLIAQDKQWLPALSTPASRVDFDVRLCLGSRNAYFTRIRLPIDVRIPAESFLKPVTSPELSARLQAEIAPHLAMRDGTPVLILHNRPDAQNREHFPFILGYTIEVRSRGVIVGTDRQGTPCKPGTWTRWSESVREWGDGIAHELEAGGATVTIRGDYTAALSVYMNSAFDDPYTEYWAGEFTVPLSFRPHPLPMLK